MDFFNQASVLGQQLIPDYAREEAMKRLSALQANGLEIQNRAAEAELAEEEAFQQMWAERFGGGQPSGVDPAAGLQFPGPISGFGGGTFNLDGTMVTRPDHQRDTGPVIAGGSEGIDTATGTVRPRESDADFYARLIARFPKRAQGLKASWDLLDEKAKKADLQTYSNIYAAGRNGAWDLAARAARERYDADRAVGAADDDDLEFVTMLESDDPQTRQQAIGMLGYKLAALTGPDKFGSTLGDIGKAQTEEVMRAPTVDKAVAEASIAQTDARFREPKLQAEIANTTASTEATFANIDNVRSQIEERAARLELDRDKLESDVQIKLTELEQTATTLSPGAEKQVTDFVVAAESARALGAKVGSLADRFEALPAGTGSGAFSGFGSWLQDMTGNTGALRDLRREYDGLVSSQAVKNLPPGAASDSDIKLALKGFPSPNADKATVVSFLRGMEKAQQFLANSEQAKADWISSNGNLGPAKRDLWVNGTRVPTGTTYGEFYKSMARVQRREKPQERSYWRFGATVPPLLRRR